MRLNLTETNFDGGPLRCVPVLFQHVMSPDPLIPMWCVAVAKPLLACPSLAPPAMPLYNVHMSRFTASQARQNFAYVLNQAAGGRPVTIERGKLRFRLVLDEKRRAPRTARPVIEILDPAVANGDWTWRHGRAGLSFKQRTKA